MKLFILTLIAAAVISVSGFAQQTITVKGNMNTGVGPQRGKLDNAFGLGTQFEFPLKNLSALKFTAGLDVGINGFKTMNYDLDFEGSHTNLDVNYTNYLFNLSSGLKYIFRDGKMWTPYAALSAGLQSYYTEMAIEDPHDPLGCSPTNDTKSVAFSMILTGIAETGVRIKTKQHSKGSVSYVEAGVGYLAGTRGKYIQFHNMDDHQEGEDDYMVQFKQNSTGMVHDHSLGTMHNTTARQLIFHVGLVFPL